MWWTTWWRSICFRTVETRQTSGSSCRVFDRTNSRRLELSISSLERRVGFRTDTCHPMLVLPRILMNPYNTPLLAWPPEHLEEALGDAMDEVLELLEEEKVSQKSQRGSRNGDGKGHGSSSGSEGIFKPKDMRDVLDTCSNVSQMLEVAMDILEDSSEIDVEEPMDDIEDYLEHAIASPQDRTRAWVLVHA